VAVEEGTIKAGEIGKLIVINAGFDLSGNTELRVVLVKPDGTVITKVKADGVTAPGTPITVNVDGVEQTFNANEYWQYATEAGVMEPAGDGWQVHGEYVDSTPKDFCGNSTTFTVYPCT
jgi:hypothetical protein